MSVPWDPNTLPYFYMTYSHLQAVIVVGYCNFLIPILLRICHGCLLGCWHETNDTDTISAILSSVAMNNFQLSLSQSTQVQYQKMIHFWNPQDKPFTKNILRVNKCGYFNPTLIHRVIGFIMPSQIPRDLNTSVTTFQTCQDKAYPSNHIQG